jgi:hypothetical protein
MATRFTSLGVKGALAVAGLSSLVTAVITTLTVTTLTATTVEVSGDVTFSSEAGTSTGVILCLRSTGTVGKCAGNGTGSGTKICSVCSAL